MPAKTITNPSTGKREKSPRSARAAGIQRELERAIMSGDLAPGMRLNENELAERFKSSRTPVREAIQRLASKGIVHIEMGKGAYVARHDPTRLLQLFEALSEIEGLCARLAARRITAREIEILEQTHENYRKVAEKGDPDEYFEKSMAFHELIVQYSRNSVLQEIARDLSNKIAPYRRRTLDLPQRIEKSVDEHSHVIDALKNHDAEAAEKLMLSHTGFVADRAMDVILLLQQAENDKGKKDN